LLAVRLLASAAVVVLLPLGAMSGQAVAAPQTPSSCQTDDKTPPTLAVHSSPPKDTKVKPGQKIRVSITATELSTPSAHQSGIRVIKLFAQDAQVAVKTFGTCGPTATPRSYQTIYTVPNDPPPVVELRAATQDWVGNETSKIADFPTGDQWAGAIGGKVQPAYCDAGAISGTMSLTVGRRGVVVGSGHTTTTPYACHPPDRGYTTPSASEDLTISGRKTKKTFALKILFAGQVTLPVTIAITGNRAKGKLVTSGDYVVETFALRCKTC